MTPFTNPPSKLKFPYNFWPAFSVEIYHSDNRIGVRKPMLMGWQKCVNVNKRGQEGRIPIRISGSSNSLLIPLTMISQLQLHGVGMKVILALQVWLIVFAHVVIHEGYGYDERNQTLPNSGRRP